MDDDITLKHCPFCGSYPIHDDLGGVYYYRYRIFCGKCGAAVPNEHIDEIAISRWNARTDVAPIVHGYWRDRYFHPIYASGCGECSICGKDNPCTNYCPNCGAKMDEEDNQ